MKLNLEQNPNLNLFTGYAADHVMVNKVRHEGNLIVTSERVLAWEAAGFDDLAADDFVALRDLGPEVVLLGTGARLRFPSPRVLRPLIDAGIGYEVMDLAAACRTYNILATEGRAVAAALIFDAP
ncbi:Mth938-like domain-containing protein [Aromatoleum buckelii]|uniref:Mth938-like domain-containing protein n=1 Tax=Aromatoleum buckelii TaxID=200254 RepID=A0ABX1N0S4_9RHOO|nr:Mth938-like domain-containing protein [Aromatoleum buckelii]MCK0511179.1 Mth938-like domain-containing protein [Aromatoleum buckelii]